MPTEINAYIFLEEDKDHQSYKALIQLGEKYIHIY